MDYFERYLYVIRILNSISNVVKSNLKIVEIGAGPSSPLKKYFENVILLDLAPNKDIDVVADASHLPFRNKVFD